MLLGRSVSACQKAFDILYTRVFQVPLQPLGPVAPLPSPSAKQRKRPAVGSETSIGLNRELQPRGAGFATVNEPPDSTAYPAGLADPGDQRKKKRGRPSKAEAEIKAAEYAARGEPYPPPRKPKNPKLSSEGMSTASPLITFTPVTMGPGAAEGASTGKKRATKVKVQSDESAPGLRGTPTTFRQVERTDGNAIETPNAISHFTQPELARTGIRPVAQEKTMEEQRVGASHLQLGALVSPAEGSTGHERASSERGNEAESEITHPTNTAHP